MTPGLLKAITANGLRTICACGFPVIKYVGAYPKNCPLCGKPLTNGDDDQIPAATSGGRDRSDGDTADYGEGE